jgi:Fe2+ or Zn2+ uptake regulation protein
MKIKTTVSVEPPIQHNRVVIRLCFSPQASIWSKPSTLRKIILRHDHIIIRDTGIEFCDPRIQSIKQTIEEIFDIDITNHSYIYTVKKK